MKRLILCALAALTVAVPVQAGIDKGNGEIGFDFGATSFDRNVSSTGAGRLDFRGGYHITRLFEIEGEIANSAHYDVHQRSTTRADIALTSILLDGVFNFHSKGGNVVPYLLAGLGTATLDFPGANVSDSGTARQFAAGCRFFFGDRSQVAFRLEASRLSENSFDVTSTHTSYTAGFSWRLGGGS